MDKIKTALRLVIVYGVLLYLSEFFKWKITSIITVFGLLMLVFFELIAALLLIVYLLWLVFRFYRSIGIKSWIPFVLMMLVILVFLMIPFNALSTQSDFAFYRNKREKIVALILNDQLVADNNEFVALPDNYKGTSSGGRVHVVKTEQTTKIFFYTFVGILDSFSGFAYVSDDHQLEFDDPEGDFKEIIQLDPHWFWFASY